MNKTLISKAVILSAGKEIVTQAGIQALNMRGVAQKCSVSVGSVYNYFPSKSDLIIATVESVWAEIMHGSNNCKSQENFMLSVLSLFETIQTGSEKYPSFFSLHSISFADSGKPKGREVMDGYFAHIQSGLLESLEKDKKVKPDTFSETFTRQIFVDFVFSNVLFQLTKEKPTCDCILEIIKRTIY